MKYVVRIPAGEFPDRDPIWSSWNGQTVTIAFAELGSEKDSVCVRHGSHGATTFLSREWLVPLAPPIHAKPIPKISTPRGGHLTPRQYLARVDRLSDPYPCVHGHFDCAAWEGGPCYAETLALVETDEEDPIQ